MLSVSTKTGDKGQTSLANGKRVSKGSLVFEVIGTIDELNSWLGLVAVKLESTFPEHRQQLLTIQDTLFYIGAEVAESPKAKLSKVALTELEEVSHTLQAKMKDGWTTKFLLPGGTEEGALLDLARTVCRRVERLAWRYNDEGEISPLILQYLNRLSDYLYVLRCWINDQENYQEKKFVTEK